MDTKVVNNNKNSSISQSTSKSRYHNNTTTIFTYKRGDKVVSRSYQDSSLNNFGILRLLFFVIFIFLVGKFLFSGGQEVFTFGAFLDMLSSAPSIPQKFLKIDIIQVPDLGFLSFLVNWFNFVIYPVSFVAFLCLNLVNILLFLFHFLKFLF